MLTELKQLPQWVGWTPNKVPKNPHNGRNASSVDPSSWGTADEAWRAKNRWGWAGIGYVFTLASGVVGVDLDHCFEEDGHLKDEAWQVVECLDSYVEYSPSGDGLHVLVKGKIPGAIVNHDHGVEIYAEQRYFTVTGNSYGTARPIREAEAELSALAIVYGTDEDLMFPWDRPRVAPIQDQPRMEGPVDARDVARALTHIPTKMDYLEWLKVLMAIHDAFPGPEGIRMAETWSPGFKGEVARKFASFDRTPKNGVNIGTLFYMAKTYGYRPGSAIRRAGGRNQQDRDAKLKIIEDLTNE